MSDDLAIDGMFSPPSERLFTAWSEYQKKTPLQSAWSRHTTCRRGIHRSSSHKLELELENFCRVQAEPARSCCHNRSLWHEVFVRPAKPDQSLSPPLLAQRRCGGDVKATGPINKCKKSEPRSRRGEQGTPLCMRGSIHLCLGRRGETAMAWCRESAQVSPHV